VHVRAIAAGRRKESRMMGAPPKLDLEWLLDALAERVAGKVRAEFARDAGPAVQPRLLTVEQAAVYLGRTKEAVQHLATDGKIPTVRSDRRIFIDVGDLDRWIEENKQNAS
jgi:excisionase family DNA binding protein